MESKPPKAQFLNKDETEELLKYYNVRQLGWCQAGDNKCFLPYAYAENCESIWRINVRTTDRWVVTFPRSGTTWIQELVWLLNNDLNYDVAARKRISERFTFPDIYLMNKTIADEVQAQESGREKMVIEQDGPLVGESLDSMASPRFIKTHLPFELLPPGLLDVGCKVVYVARNPKDVIVSFYHMKSSQNIIKYTGDFASFWNFFRRDLKMWCPYWSHVKKAWNLRNHPNLLFLFYEEMKMDMPSVIRKASEFFGRPCTEDEVAKLDQHLKFESFQKNPMIGSRAVNGRELVSKTTFVRKGEIGGWKEFFTPELEAQADKWIEENLRDTDLTFPYLQSTSTIKQRRVLPDK